MSSNTERKPWHGKTLYEDPDFPAAFSTLFRGGSRFGVLWKRPWEISQNPVFIDAGTKYNDIDQGELGDCWFLSSVACLAISQHKDALSRVIPKDQEFGAGYTGKFNFNFWRNGTWVNVVIDDRLPTYDGKLVYCKNLNQPYEYWGPLLEKAYAKFYGNYNVLDGGRTHTAMVDLTGGLSEMVPLKEEISDQDLTDLLMRCQKLNSFLGGAIFIKEFGSREWKLASGLLEGHAYAIVNVKEVNTSLGKFVLLHLRNPHGRGEWRGSWSDNSREWNTLSAEDKKETSETVNDGEFWISVSDFRKHFDELEICHLIPEGLLDGSTTSLTKYQWIKTEHAGKWDITSAGGPPISLMSRKFWSNPQIELHVLPSPRPTAVVISLFEVIDLLKRDEDDISIGFVVFQFPQGKKAQSITSDNYNEISPRKVKSSGVSWPYREKTISLVLESGDYIIVPYTSRAGQQSDFYLRVFAESHGSSSVTSNDSITDVVQPDPTLSSDVLAMNKAFDALAGKEAAIDAEELVEVLNAGLEAAEGKPIRYSVETCRCLISLTKTLSPKGLIDKIRLNKVWNDLGIWRKAFQLLDKDKDKLIDTRELKPLFDIIELNISSVITEALIKRYGGKKEKISEDDYLQGVCTALQLRGKFLELKKEGKIEIEFGEWMSFGLSI